MSKYTPTPREVWQRYVSPKSLLDPLIMDVIEASGEEGIISQDVEAKIGRSHQAVSANITRLAQRGLIEIGGYGRTVSGMRARKWRIRDQSGSESMVLYPGAGNPPKPAMPEKQPPPKTRRTRRRLSRLEPRRQP